MKILGIDTSGYANAIGLVDGGKVMADFVFETRIDSLKNIVANIESALESAGLGLDDIQGFGIGLGPGSWTGIRVGVTVGKILAYSTGKPLSGVSTLEALAYGARDRASIICPIISAGTKDTVYAAFYRVQDGTVSMTGDYYVGDIKGLSEMVQRPMTIVGSEAVLYGETISRVTSLSIETVEDVPKGSAVALLAAGKLERGESDDVMSLTPLYLKESTARAFQSRYSNRTQVKGQDL
jgi:tRNA threonylcarbamoyladenosine biosynthesis protein TsaB